MPELLSIASALPEHTVTLSETQAHIASLLNCAESARRFQAMAAHSRIVRRHLVLPPADAIRIQSIEQRQGEFLYRARELGERAARSAISSAGVDPASIGVVIAVSCTGYAMPSLDVQLSRRLGLNPAARRIPITELGCSAGAAALGLAHELLRSDNGTALIISTELCSLCMQTIEPAASDVLGWILFGDAAAAAVVSSADDRGLARIVASKTVMWPESERDLGMKLTSTGLRLELSARVPRIVRRHLRNTVESFLGEHDAALSDLTFWALHPGGPRVMDAVIEALELSEDAIRPTSSVWEHCGNVSSATALLVLGRIFEAPRYDDELGMMLAIGPGMTCEMVLLRSSGRQAARHVDDVCREASLQPPP